MVGPVRLQTSERLRICCACGTQYDDEFEGEGKGDCRVCDVRVYLLFSGVLRLLRFRGSGCGYDGGSSGGWGSGMEVAAASLPFFQMALCYAFCE